jgi:multidrug efflux pump subunit AcrA (membrane-fusion protein)
MIFEQFDSDVMSNSIIQTAAFVVDQVHLALPRLELLESIPFLKWWAATSSGRRTMRFRRVMLCAGLLIGVGVLAARPMEFRLSAEGELLAQKRHTIFAPENGIVRELKVTHGGKIRAGDPLLTLENLDLHAQLRELTGQLVQLRERRRSLEATRSVSRLSERDQIDVQSNLVEVASSVEHTERQAKLLQQRLDQLKVVAPADGVITSWNVEQSLLHRPVLQGDALLQEIDPQGPWIAELQIPENRAGYVVRQVSHLKPNEPLRVEFVLATEPQRRFPATLRSIGARTELTGAGHIVRAVIELDPSDLPPLRDGAEVKARLHCGQQRAGFIWFRELIEVIQTYLWY